MGDMLGIKPADVPGLFERVGAKPATGDHYSPAISRGNEIIPCEACVLAAMTLDRLGLARGEDVLSTMDDETSTLRDGAKVYADTLGLTVGYCLGVISGWDGVDLDTEPNRPRVDEEADYRAGIEFGRAAHNVTFPSDPYPEPDHV